MTEQATNGAADEQQPQFSMQRIYLRDLSFESPKSPEIFRQEWNPSISLDLNTRQKQLDGDFYEVVLTVSVTVKNGEDTTAFIAEVQQAIAEAAEMVSGTMAARVPMAFVIIARVSGITSTIRMMNGKDRNTLTIKSRTE